MVLSITIQCFGTIIIMGTTAPDIDLTGQIARIGRTALTGRIVQHAHQEALIPAFRAQRGPAEVLIPASRARVLQDRRFTDRQGVVTEAEAGVRKLRLRRAWL